MSSKAIESLLQIADLHKRFKMGGFTVHAVNGVSFDIYPGEAVGLVGESGCGKTTTARCILRLTEPTAGHVYFGGADLVQLSGREMRVQRRHLQMVFQDPNTSLNPRFTIRRTLAEPLQLHGLAYGESLEEQLRETMIRVNLEPDHLDRYPHQLSGGQKQRVGIARAIITEPQFVALDEPTSSLDMSIRIHIISLLKRLQEELGMTYLFISHDLSTVRNLCHRVMVMYLGVIVETGPVEAIFSQPLHFYTRALLSAIPIPDPRAKRQRILLKGETPSLRALPRGCVLQDRCPDVHPACRKEMPPLYDVGDGHRVACFAFHD